MVEGEIALMRLLTRIKEFPFVSSAAALEKQDGDKKKDSWRDRVGWRQMIHRGGVENEIDE